MSFSTLSFPLVQVFFSFHKSLLYFSCFFFITVSYVPILLLLFTFSGGGCFASILNSLTCLHRKVRKIEKIESSWGLYEAPSLQEQGKSEQAKKDLDSKLPISVITYKHVSGYVLFHKSFSFFPLKFDI